MAPETFSLFIFFMALLKEIDKAKKRFGLSEDAPFLVAAGFSLRPLANGLSDGIPIHCFHCTHWLIFQ
jgi:hypothetical protein